MTTNQGKEYAKVIVDIIEQELDIAPTNPLSTNVNDHRVFIKSQNFIFPTYSDMFVVLSVTPGRVISNRSGITTDTTPKELQELVVQENVDIDVMSQNSEARTRKEEVIMALNSQYAQQKMAANGFRIFSFPNTFVDVSENEGGSNVYRYRTSFAMHCRYFKEKTVGYYDSFDNEVDTD